jgi:hypothetical protein
MHFALKAVYEESQTFTLGFVTYSNDVFSDLSLDAGEAIPQLPIPTKEGFIFDGWYEDPFLQCFV